MFETQQQDFDVKMGSAFNPTFLLKQNGQILNISLWTFEAQIGDLWVCTVGNGGLIVSGAAGLLQINVTKQQTQAAPRPGKFPRGLHWFLYANDNNGSDGYPLTGTVTLSLP